MFPKEIARIALVAIHAAESQTLDYLLNELLKWTDAPDPATGEACKLVYNRLLIACSEKRLDLKRYANTLTYLARYIDNC